MHFHKTKVVVGVLCLFFVFAHFPTPAAAYKLVETNAVRLTDRYALFTITYQLGFTNREALVPMDTVRGSDPDNKRTAYDLISNAGTTTAHMVRAIVVSDAAIRGREYHIAKGMDANFTLVAIVETQNTNALGLKITELPFTMVDNRVTVRAAVPRKNLSPFSTALLPDLATASTPTGK